MARQRVSTAAGLTRVRVREAGREVHGVLVHREHVREGEYVRADAVLTVPRHTVVTDGRRFTRWGTVCTVPAWPSCVCRGVDEREKER